MAADNRSATRLLYYFDRCSDSGREHLIELAAALAKVARDRHIKQIKEYLAEKRGGHQKRQRRCRLPDNVIPFTAELVERCGGGEAQP